MVGDVQLGKVDKHFSIAMSLVSLARLVRPRLFIMAGVIGLLIVAVSIAMVLVRPPVSSLVAVIGFNFPQAEADRYPNGAPFAISDVTSRAVLTAVWEDNRLKDHGVGLETFIGYVSIVPHAASEDFLKARYQIMLSRKGLTTAEVAAMEREFTSELNSKLKRSAKITLTTPFFSPLSGSLKEKVLQSIPQQWSLQAIRKLGVVDIPVGESSMIQQGVLEGSSLHQVADYFYKVHDALMLSIDAVSETPGGDTLRDPDSGVGLLDLRSQLEDIERYWISNFDSLVQSVGSAEASGLRSTETRLLDVRQQQKILLAQAETYKFALRDYDEVRSSQRAVGPEAVTTTQREGGAQLSLQGDTLQRLIDLGSQTKEADFRQSLTTKRVLAELRAQNLTTEILRLERRAEGAKKVRLGAQDDGRTKKLIDEITTRLTAVASSLGRIQEGQKGRFLEARGALYAGPAISNATSAGVLSEFRVPAALLVLLAVVTLLLFFAARLYEIPREMTARSGL